MRTHERREPGTGIGLRLRVRVLERGVRGGFEPHSHPVHDGPQDVLLGGDMRVQAGPLDVERPRDIAHARPGVAPLAEERARDVLDLAASRRLDHADPPP
jgi:hypothetical protein